MLNSGTLSPNPGIYRFSARMIVYTEVTCTEDKAPQGCDPSADARAGMARGGLPAAPNSNPRLPRAIAYCRPKMVLTMGSTLSSAVARAILSNKILLGPPERVSIAPRGDDLSTANLWAKRS